MDSPIGTILYAASTAPLANPALYAAAYRIVTPERRAKTDRLRCPGDRYLSLGAELLLRYGLHLAGLPFDSDLDCEKKPFFRNSEVRFNLSHSGEYALCALSGQEIGCDVEKIKSVNVQIAKRFFSNAEYEDIAVQPTEKAREERFFRYWTLKESFLKATGLGMKLPLNAFCITLGEEITVEQSVDNRSYSFREFRTVPGYRCAVCTAGDCRDARLQMVELGEAIEAIA